MCQLILLSIDKLPKYLSKINNKFLLKLLIKAGNNINNIPSKYLTTELLNIYIDKTTYFNNFMIENYLNIIDYDTYLKLINKKYHLYEQLKHLQTKELVDIYVKNCENLKNIREDLLTDDIILKGITKNYLNIRYVPKKLQTLEICLETLKFNKTDIMLFDMEFNNNDILPYLNENYLNEDLYIKIVNKNPNEFNFLPKELQNMKMMYYAFINNNVNLNIKLLLEMGISKIVEKEFDVCPVCQEMKEYNVIYSCHENHYVCLDCKDKNCYYRCGNGKLDKIEIVYLNNKFVSI